MPCRPGEKIVTTFVASKAILDRKNVAYESRLEASILLIQEAALVIEHSSMMHKIIQDADGLVANDSPRYTNGTGRYPVPDDIFVEPAKL